MKKDSKKTPTKMVFENDTRNPQKQPKTLREATGVKDILPTKNGIYRPTPQKPVAKIPQTTPVKAAPKPAKKDNVQYSSREKAEKAMHKGVKRNQKGKSLGNMFNR
jgi:hypothetical protein